MYIIQNEQSRRYYVGYSHDPVLRLEHHNEGWTRSTKGRGKWKIVYLEKFEEKGSALRREKEIKRRKSRAYIEQLIHAKGRPGVDKEVTK